MLGGLGELPGATEDFGELQRAPGAAGAGTNAAPCSRAVRAARGAFHHGVFLHLRGDPGGLRLVLGGVAGESGGVGLGGRPRIQPDGFRTVAPVCGDVAEGPRRLGDPGGHLALRVPRFGEGEQFPYVLFESGDRGFRGRVVRGADHPLTEDPRAAGQHDRGERREAELL